VEVVGVEKNHCLDGVYSCWVWCGAVAYDRGWAHRWSADA
jgi:hypothetical protein